MSKRTKRYNDNKATLTPQSCVAELRILATRNGADNRCDTKQLGGLRFCNCTAFAGRMWVARNLLCVREKVINIIDQ
jgi:hypothetical protein